MKKIIRPLLIVVLLITAVSLVIFLLSKYKITRVDCESQFGPCSQSIADNLNKFSDKSLTTSLRSSKEYLKKERRVSQFSIRFLLPSTIKVYVVEKKAAAALGKASLDKYLIVDSSGTVLGVDKSTLLPVVNVVDEELIYAEGAVLPENLIFAVNLTEYMYSYYSTKLTTLYKDRVEIRLNDGKLIIFPTIGEQDVLMGALNLILSRLNNESSEIRIGEIDLRYKNPIIR